MKNENNYSFRLFDFNVYNEKRESETSSENEGPIGTFKPRVDNSVFMIQMFGINEKGETCSIVVDDFQPFFYIHVPDAFTSAMKHAFLKEIKKKIGPFFASSIVECEFVQRKNG